MKLKDFHQAGQIFDEDKVELGDPAVIDSEVPGVDLDQADRRPERGLQKKIGRPAMHLRL